MLKIIESLSRATTWDEYRAARKAAGRMDIVAQYAAVDSFLDARARITAAIGGRP